MKNVVWRMRLKFYAWRARCHALRTAQRQGLSVAEQRWVLRALRRLEADIAAAGSLADPASIKPCPAVE